MSSPAVAVVGGGITGLTAAWRLRQSGADVSLFESGGRCGGVIGTVKKDGYQVELGPNTLLETTPLIAELIDALGLQKRMLHSDPAAEARYIVRDGKPVAMPGGGFGLVATKLFSIPAKLRLLREPFIGRSNPDVEESLADFVRRRLGGEFLDYAINPFVGGIYAGNPENISVREAFPKLLAAEQEYGSLIGGQIRGAKARKKRGEMSKQNAAKLSFDDGLQVFTDALADALGDRVYCHSPLISIERHQKRWKLTFHDDTPAAAEFDAVVVALPAYRTAELSITGDDGAFIGLESLAEIEYPPVASVALGFRRDQVTHPLDGFGALVPEIEDLSILGTIFSSSLFPDRAPAGHVLITSYLGGTRAPQLVRGRSHEELCATTLADLRRLYGITGEPTFAYSTNYERAIPQYNLGYRSFRKSMDDAEAVLPGFFLAGHSRDGISLGDSITSGDRAAGKIDNFLLNSA